jgi:hypothetical protein
VSSNSATLSKLGNRHKRQPFHTDCKENFIMPYYVPPTSDLNRLRFLQRTVTSATADILAGDQYLSSDTVAKVTALAAEFEVALNAISSTQRTRSNEALERTEALTELSAAVRDLWAVLRRRVRRLKQPVNVLLFYGLPIDGNTPNPTVLDDWIPLGQSTINGDAEAVAAGFPPMSNPSAAELQLLLDSATAEAGEADASDRVYDKAQATVSDLRVGVDKMINDIMAELRFRLRDEDNASQRRIMRTYGTTFKYLEGESTDPDDQVDVVVEV